MSTVELKTHSVDNRVVQSISMTLLDSSDLANGRYVVECNLQLRDNYMPGPYDRDAPPFFVTGIAEASDLYSAQDIALERAMFVAQRLTPPID